MNLEAIINFARSYLGPVMSLLALIFSGISFKMARRATLYSDIDGRYLELLKLGINNPKFINHKLTSKYKESFEGEYLLSYGQYAFAAWNIVETICDRREDRKLFKTWKTVIKEENRLHREWLNGGENQHKFKNDFWRFIIGNSDFPCPSCQKTDRGRLCPRCRELKAMADSEDEMPVA